jgi:DNA-binding HxlR family transcriptional regulator
VNKARQLIVLPFYLQTMIQLVANTMLYGKLQEEIDNISQCILTRTLRNLEPDVLVLRKVYIVPPMVEYFC